MEASEKPPIGLVLESYYGVRVPTGAHGRAKLQCPHPGHEDRRASASVDHNKNMWRCFACGEGGDSWAVIMSEEGVTFPEAKRIAAEHGWTSGEAPAPQESARRGRSRAGRVRLKRRRRI